MSKLYRRVGSALLILGTMASCARSQYTFAPNQPAYHGTEAVAAAPHSSEPTAAAPVAPAALPTAVAAPAALATATPLPAAAHKAPLPLAKRLLATRMVKQLTKAASKQQNTAHVARPASRAGTAGIVIGIGAVLVLIGGLIGGSNIVVTLGGVTFLIGLIMLIVALIRGNK